MNNKALVILVNLFLCVVFAYVGWRAWEEGAPEFTMVVGCMIGVLLLAIYGTIRGRTRP